MYRLQFEETEYVGFVRNFCKICKVWNIYPSNVL